MHMLSLILAQVSETENLRKNLAVERMIVEGCDILLDVNQVFVRQGECHTGLPRSVHFHYQFQSKDWITFDRAADDDLLEFVVLMLSATHIEFSNRDSFKIGSFCGRNTHEDCTILRRPFWHNLVTALVSETKN